MEGALAYLLAYGSYSLILAGLLAAGLGVPVPEDVYVLASGALSQRAVMWVPAALVICATGILVGDAFLFLIARKVGALVYRRPWLMRVFPPDRRAQLDALVMRRGGLAILGARNLPLVRMPVFAVAAIHGMPMWRFMVWDTLGLCVSLPLYFGLGYFLADQVKRVQQEASSIAYLIATVVIALAAIAGGILYVRSRLSKPAGPPAED